MIIKKKLISIIIPCFNEFRTVDKLINKIKKQNINKQIIIVDDFSNDGTRDLIKKKYIKK